MLAHVAVSSSTWVAPFCPSQRIAVVCKPEVAIGRHQVERWNRVKTRSKPWGDNIARVKHAIEAGGPIGECGYTKELIEAFLSLWRPQIVAAAVVEFKQDP